MKKYFFHFLVFSLSMAAHSQTVLSSVKFGLQKPLERQQIIAASNTGTGEFFVFASDKEKVTAFKFNSAMFLRDSISCARPGENYANLTGYSFSENTAYTYWASQDFSKIACVGQNFKDRTFTSRAFTYSFQEETFVSAFSDRDAFYLITVSDEKDELNISIFKNGVPEKRVVDFSSFELKDKKGKTLKLFELFEAFPVERIDTQMLNPLFSTVAKSKLYMDDTCIYLTLDHIPSYTQVIRIPKSDFSPTLFRAPQPEITLETKSNSFLYDGKLYQIRTNGDELSLSSKSFDQPVYPEPYHVFADDTITFKNSPLLSQIGDDRPQILKNTKRFLDRISANDIGVSVYQTSDAFLVTSGGIRYVNRTGNIILGATLGVAVMAGGSGSFDFGGVMPDKSSQQIFFDSLFDKEFKHLNREQEPLAFDHLAQYLSEKQPENYYLAPFQDYFVLALYDRKTKQVVLRKFEDGFPAASPVQK